MKTLIICLFLVCASLLGEAQTNFVKNGDFERYDTCPYELDQLSKAKFWRPPVDSLWNHPGEYNNECSNYAPDKSCHVPDNTHFFQYAHSGLGMTTLHLFYDKTLPAPPLTYGYPYNYRDYAQVRLYKNLRAGISYCVSFWVNKTEAYCYAHNKIGAYLDDGSINSAVDSPGKEITSVMPQVYTNTVVGDTQNWVKVEGTFTAAGNENTITIGNFFPNSAMTVISGDCWLGGLPQYSYYLFDDISVVPVGTKANAGPDRWVELGKTLEIGPVEDSTARGMDCRWYHKGTLIDSGNVIRVAANTTKYAVDTYVVVQTLCGIVTRDTMLLRTVGLGFTEASSGTETKTAYSLFPNPAGSEFFIRQHVPNEQAVSVKIYSAIGSLVYQSTGSFVNGSLKVSMGQQAQGLYLICIDDGSGKNTCLRFVLK
jgi:hypothetical protein